MRYIKFLLFLLFFCWGCSKKDDGIIKVTLFPGFKIDTSNTYKNIFLVEISIQNMTDRDVYTSDIGILTIDADKGYNIKEEVDNGIISSYDDLVIDGQSILCRQDIFTIDSLFNYISKTREADSLLNHLRKKYMVINDYSIDYIRIKSMIFLKKGEIKRKYLVLNIRSPDKNIHLKFRAFHPLDTEHRVENLTKTRKKVLPSEFMNYELFKGTVEIDSLIIKGIFCL